MNNRLQSLKETMPKTVEWMIAAGEEVTEEKVQAAQQAQRYQNREQMPESYLWMSDLYNELTEQEPTKRVLLDWMSTFEEWKQEKLQPEHIRGAWQQSQDINKGFHVGRPGALTIVAVSIKSKSNKPMSVQVDPARIDATKKLLNELWENKVFVPRPAHVERPKNLLPSRKVNR